MVTISSTESLLAERLPLPPYSHSLWSMLTRFLTPHKLIFVRRGYLLPSPTQGSWADRTFVLLSMAWTHQRSTSWLDTHATLAPNSVRPPAPLSTAPRPQPSHTTTASLPSDPT